MNQVGAAMRLRPEKKKKKKELKKGKKGSHRPISVEFFQGRQLLHLAIGKVLRSQTVLCCDVLYIQSISRNYINSMISKISIKYL
jgi:hypothetical protein